MRCPKHPELETRFRCEKFDVYMCEKCMECRSPDLHCKHRQACLIWEFTRQDLDSEGKENKRNA